MTRVALGNSQNKIHNGAKLILGFGGFWVQVLLPLKILEAKYECTRTLGTEGVKYDPLINFIHIKAIIFLYLVSRARRQGKIRKCKKIKFYF
jgi:hypothetical protein